MSEAIKNMLFVIHLRRQYRNVIAFGKALRIPLDHLRGTIAGLLACECNLSRSQARMLACAIVV